MQTITYKLDITPGGVPLTIHISQYDVGLRQYIFQPYTSVGEFTYVSGATVTLEATKPDGYAVIHDCTYSSDGTITYTVQEQLAAKPGKVWSKIVIRVDNDVLGTGTIVWLVDEAGVKDSAIVSESDVSGIHGMVDAEVKNAMFSFLPTESTNGAIAHFEDGADDIPVKDLKIGIVPQQSGSGDPSPSNVRPITGWMGATVTRAGKNLSYGVLTRANINGAGKIDTSLYNLAYAYVVKDEKYIVSNNEDAGWVYGFLYDVPDFNDVSYNGARTVQNPKSDDTLTFTAPITGYVVIRMPQGSTKNQIELGETATDYSAYVGNNYAIDWTSEAGTVYGGTMDVTTGVLTVDKGVMDIGDYTWSYDSSWSRFSTTVSDMKSYGTRLTPYISSCYVGIDDGRSLSNVPYGGVYSGQSGTYDIYIKENSYTDPAAFKSARTGQKIVYPLKNTLVYQLTPTEVRSLLGINNIWSDTGDTEVEYKADAQAYMDKRITATKSIIAGVEAEYKATKNYTTGQFLIVGDNLYKVTANIASGATIAVGTNVVSTTVAEQLIALANA